MSWRRGKTPNRAQWRRFRLEVLDRDGWRCVLCGKAAGRLEVDHIRGVDAGAFDFANCQTLCVRCHVSKSAEERGIPDHERKAWEQLIASRMADNV